MTSASPNSNTAMDESADVLSRSAQTAATLIAEADALIFCSGAGLGVDSGVGTFRGTNAGKWPPLEQRKMEFSQMSQPSWFQEDGDPELAFGFWCVACVVSSTPMSDKLGKVLALRRLRQQVHAARWVPTDAQMGRNEETQSLLLHQQH